MTVPKLTEHPVGIEMMRRLAGKPTPGTRLALAIEGGGMRAVVTSGACAGLESYGIDPSIFDAVYGSSAGSVIAAYYLAHQIRLGTPVFYEDLTSLDFLNIGRPLLGRSIMNLDFLIRDVIVNRKPLEFDKVIETRKLRAVATDIEHARRVTFGPPESRSELQNVLQASANVPLIAGPPYKINGRSYVDASISEAIPWLAARDDGATHVLVLSSRPLGQSKSASITNTLVASLWTHRHTGEMKRLARSRIETSAERAQMLQALTLRKEGQAPLEVYAVCPNMKDADVSQLTQDAGRLIKACEAGFRAVALALGKPPPEGFHTTGNFDRV